MQPSRVSARFAIALFALAAAAALALFYPALRSTWAYDDFEYINTTANVLAGKQPLLPALLEGHDEHFVPLFRIALFAYLQLFGLDTFAWRVMTVLWFALCACFVAVLAMRYSGERRAGVAALIAFVAPCGFSSMWVWFSSGAAVPMAFAMLSGACVVLACGAADFQPAEGTGERRARRSTGLRHIAAGVLVVLALLTWSVFAPLALLPAIVDEMERRREGRRGLGAFTLFCIAAMLAVLLVPLRAINEGRYVSITGGLPRALFLALVTPLRYFLPGVSIVTDNDRTTALIGGAIGLAMFGVLLTLLIVLWRRGVPRLAVLAVLTAIPGLAYLLFVGVGRARVGLALLFDGDRYFFPLLMPIALLAGAIAASLALRNWARAALIAAIAAGVVLHHRTFLRRIPGDIYEQHGRRFASLQRLVARLENAGPIAIPDNILWFEDVHSHVAPTVLTHILSDGDRVRLGGAVDAPRLNTQLDAWAREIGESVPFLRVANGHLVNLHFTTTVDFSIAPFDKQVVRGFYEWRKPYRWMSRRGELEVMLAQSDLTVRLAAPLSDLQRIHPDWKSIPVRLTLIDEAWGGYTAPLGTIEITKDGLQSYRIRETPVITKVGLGRNIRIVLECDRVWRPSEVYGTSDTREHTVQLFTFGTDYLGDTGTTVKMRLEN